jgi:hypothetical protein
MKNKEDLPAINRLVEHLEKLVFRPEIKRMSIKISLNCKRNACFFGDN